MNAIQEAAYEGEESECINQLQCHQEVLFESCVLCTGGIYIGKKYLEACQLDKKWSTAAFPNKDPTNSTMRLWCKALEHIMPNRRVWRPLMKFEREGPKTWDWKYNAEQNKVYHIQ